MASASLEVRQPYLLGETLFSGQAFRWRRAGDSFEGFVANTPVALRPAGARVEVRTPNGADMTGEVARYLRLDDPMAAIYRSISKDDHMRGAIDRFRGLHLLAQDPWETTVSFIASSASNVAKISRSLEMLCRRFGGGVDFAGSTRHTMPTPRELARADLAGLRACEFGYRAKYLKATARAVSEGEVSLDAVARLETPQAQRALVDALDGIGPKVAACIALFAMGKEDAFPVDRHVQRAVGEMYFDGRPISAKLCEEWGRSYFGGRAGYAQQYLFHERRARGRPTAKPTT